MSEIPFDFPCPGTNCVCDNDPDDDFEWRCNCKGRGKLTINNEGIIRCLTCGKETRLEDASFDCDFSCIGSGTKIDTKLAQKFIQNKLKNKNNSSNNLWNSLANKLETYNISNSVNNNKGPKKVVYFSKNNKNFNNNNINENNPIFQLFKTLKLDKETTKNGKLCYLTLISDGYFAVEDIYDITKKELCSEYNWKTGNAKYLIRNLLVLKNKNNKNNKNSNNFNQNNQIIQLFKTLQLDKKTTKKGELCYKTLINEDYISLEDLND